MNLLIDFLSFSCLFVGTVALITGSFGIIRLPDVYSRIHAAGIIDTAAVGFIVLGMILQSGISLTSVKLALIVLFLFFTSPISGHAVAMMANKFGVKPQAREINKDKKKIGETDG